MDFSPHILGLFLSELNSNSVDSAEWADNLNCFFELTFANSCVIRAVFAGFSLISSINRYEMSLMSAERVDQMKEIPVRENLVFIAEWIYGGDSIFCSEIKFDLGLCRIRP